MGMVQADDVIIRIAQICPERVDLDIRHEQELAVFVDRTLNDFVDDPHADAPLLPIGDFIGDILPAAADIYSLPVSGVTDVLTASLHFFEPLILLLGLAEVALDDEPGTVLDQDPQVVGGIIAGIHTDEQRLFSQLMGHGEGFP